MAPAPQQPLAFFRPGRHFGERAAVDYEYVGCPQFSRTHRRVHRRVAAAQHGDPRRHVLDPAVLDVAQEAQGIDDSVGLSQGRRTRQSEAQEHGVVFRAQLGQRNLFAQGETVTRLHATGSHGGGQDRVDLLHA